MANSTLITDYMGYGLYSARPATPPVPGTAMYYATDKSINYIWTGSAWVPEVSVPAGGTSGQVLTKNSSTDYDMSWVTPSGGGGGTTLTEMGYQFGMNFATGQYVQYGRFNAVPILCTYAMTIHSVKAYVTANQSTASVQAGIYADNGMTPTGGALLGSSSTVNGVTKGLLKLTLTSGVTVSAGTLIWAGILGTNQSFQGAATDGSGTGGVYYSGTSLASTWSGGDNAAFYPWACFWVSSDT